MALPYRRTALWVVAILGFVYVGVYAYLSRRGAADYSRYGFKGFLYCRSDQLLSADPAERQSAKQMHKYCGWLFAPINCLDSQINSGCNLAYGPCDIPFR